MILPSAVQTHLDTRGGVKPRWLLWISAKNRSTGDTETQGFWTGADDREFIIDGAARSYFGAGGLIGLESLTFEAGLNIQLLRVALASVTPEVEQAVQVYDVRLAPAELHCAFFSLSDNTLIDVARAFKGSVEALGLDESPAPNSTATGELVLASSARAGTRTLALKKSDAAQKLRGGDRGRRYADFTGSQPVWWGEVRAGETPSVTTSDGRTQADRRKAYEDLIGGHS